MEILEDLNNKKIKINIKENNKINYKEKKKRKNNNNYLKIKVY
jgi:hypothetical protein